MGLDSTCANVIPYGEELHGGMGFVTLTVYTLSAGAREFNVVYVGASIVGRKLFLKEVMWRRMVGWASFHYVRSEESMVVTLFELLATYGIQVWWDDVCAGVVSRDSGSEYITVGIAMSMCCMT